MGATKKSRFAGFWRRDDKQTIDPTAYVGPDARANEQKVRQGFTAKAKRFLNRLPLAHETVAMYFCMLDPKTPIWVKTTAAAALAYFILPLDAIPDLLPVVGLSDDAGVIAAALTAVSAHVSDDHRQKARQWMAAEHLEVEATVVEVRSV